MYWFGSELLPGTRRLLGSYAESQAPLEPEVPEPGARTQPGTGMALYTPEQHDRYDGRFIIAGNNVHQVGTLDDESGWDHIGDDGTNVRAIGGTMEIDVNEIDNSGTFRAELELPEGTYVVNLEQFQEFSPCQDGGSRRSCSSTEMRAAVIHARPRADLIHEDPAARDGLHGTDTGFGDQHPVGIGEAEHRRPHRHLGAFSQAYHGVTGLERGLGVAPPSGPTQ